MISVAVNCLPGLVPISVGNPVTSATAAAAVPVLRDGTVITADVPVLAPEVIRMTGRAIGGVLRRRPGNDRADGRSVTGGAAQVALVIAGIIAIRIVTENGGPPGVGGMAQVALRGRG